MRFLQHDALFWRKLAHLGASKGPLWWLKYSPPAFGIAAAALVPSARKTVARNLERARGEASTIKNAIDVCRTFATYAGSLAESLAQGSKNHAAPNATIIGRANVEKELLRGKGLIIATAHTAGWDVAGTLLGQHLNAEVVIVMQSERDQRARRLQDEGREKAGVKIVHVDDDPLSSLSLLHHLKRGGIAAVQIDRLPSGMRGRDVWLLGQKVGIPEGPLRLSQLTGAPIVPLFCARLGFRNYLLEAGPAVTVERRASNQDLDHAAQHLADRVTDFVRSHPTQWFNFS